MAVNPLKTKNPNKKQLSNFIIGKLQIKKEFGMFLD